MRTRRFLAFALAVIMLLSNTITASATSSSTISGNDIVEVTEGETLEETLPSEEAEESSVEESTEAEEGLSEEPSVPAESEEIATEEATTSEATVEEVTTEETASEAVTEEVTDESETETAEELETPAIMADVEEEPYVGEVNEMEMGDNYTFKWLSLHPVHLGKDTFSAEDISQILSNYEEGTFDEISIAAVSDTLSGSVSANVVNAARPYLKESTQEHENSLYFMFQHPSNGNGISWMLADPAEQTTDQNNLSFSLSIVDDEALLSFSEQSFAAGRVDVSIFRNNELDPSGVAALKSVFGETSTAITVKKTNEENFNVSAYLDFNEHEANLHIRNISDMVPGRNYELEKEQYTGRIDVWDDGTKELAIRYEEAGAAFTQEELLDILDNYSVADGLSYIYIEQPSSASDVVYKSVVDKAANLLAHGTIKFAFRDEANGYTTEWQLEGISAGVVQNADQTVSANFVLTEDNQLMFNRGEFDFNVDEYGAVSLGCFTDPTTELAQKLFAALGNEEGNRRIEIPGQDTVGNFEYNKEYNNVWLYLNSIDKLTPNTDYPIENYTYRGDVNEMTDGEGNVMGTGLWISALSMDKDALDLETLNAIVDYWVNTRGMQFDRVSIEQKYTSNNVIKKDLINSALALLSNPSEQELEFVFCGCYLGEDKHTYVQNDMNWTLYGPKTATKDINANITVTGKGGAGVSVVLKANTYPAEDTYVNFWMNEQAGMVQDKLIPSWGRPQEDSNLVVLEKAATLNNNVHASYTNGGNDGWASLFLASVEDWTPGIDNRLLEVYYRHDICVGDEVRLPLFSYDPNDPQDPGYPPEDDNEEWNHPDMPMKDIKFKLLTPEYATLTNYDILTATVPYQTVYTLCTYTSVSGQTCLEVLGYPTLAAVHEVSFAETEMDIEWREGNEYHGFLEVKILPLAVQNYVSPQGFEWYVSGNSIELVEHEWHYTYQDENGQDVEITQMRPNGEFIVKGYGTTTVTVRCGESESVCTINVLEPVQVPEYPQIFAIPAVDKTLADLGNLDDLIRARCETEYTGTFTWKDDTISLEPYANMEYSEFGAIYTEADGRQVPVTVTVDMLRITAIDLFSAHVVEYDVDEDEDGIAETVKDIHVEPLDNTSLEKEDELVIGYQVGINRQQFDDDGMTDEFSTFARYISEGKMIFRWKQELPELPENYEDYDVYWNGRVQKPRLFNSEVKGKKTVAVEAVNLLTGKVIFESKAIINVTEKPVFTFDEAFEFADMTDPENEMKGTYIFRVGEDNYKNAKKLTFKSADTAVLKLGKVKVADPVDGMVEITVPYEFKKFGRTVLKITAADEMKTSTSIPVERIDYAPKLSATSVTMDKTWFNYFCEAEVNSSTEYIYVAFHGETSQAGDITIKEEAYRDLFFISGDAHAFFVVANDSTTLNKKSYTITLVIPYTIGNGEEVHYAEQTLKIAVKSSKIKPTVKQTKKINEFYDLYSNEAEAVFTVKIPYALQTMSVNNDSVFRSSYVQISNDTYELTLRVKDGVDVDKLTDAQKKVTLSYALDGTNHNGPYGHIGSTEIKVKTENKAPKLVLSKKSDTLYPNMYISGSGFAVLDKTSGELVDIAGSAALVLDKKNNVTQVLTSESEPQNAPYEYLTVGKNKYFIFANGADLNFWMTDTVNAVKSSADKMIIRIQKENWNGYVDLTYTAKVDLKVPKLKLASKTITINANDAVYKYQSAETNINVTGYTGTWFDEVWVTGANDKARAALANNMTFDYYRDEAMIRFAIADKGDSEDGTLLKTGSYKFKVWTRINERKLSTDITVKVIDKTVAKAVSVSKKGSIDVLRRDTTEITLNPKFTNLSGRIGNFELRGRDAQLFEYYYDGETGKCVVKARDGVNYSTKISYKVTPVYTLDNNGVYEVEGKAQTIKVKQGKPKVSVVTSTNILYGDRSQVFFAFDALLNEEYIAIRDVELLNYTNDLAWEWYSESQQGALFLQDGTPKDITKASGKYTLKFAVTYEDAAGNEKAAQVSYKLNIVR